MMLADSSCQVAVSSPMLPPCRICGEKASGFHYGANTCEACKGFFRRSLARKEEYKCAADGNCEIEPGKRNACAACRYQKCLSVGMSKTAIKTGRYTHEKKTKDIEEVKRLQLQKKLKDEGKIVMTSEEKEKELEKIIKHITTVHLQQTPHTPEFFEKLPEREAKFLERRALQEQMFGTMKPLPREEYRQIYQSTGIDIDGRREMITHMIPCIEKAIKRFIAFAKALPGFKELPIDDQIALIKASRFESQFLESYESYRTKSQLFISSMSPDLVMDMNEFAKYFNTDFVLEKFRMAERIQKLNLTTEEIVVLKGMTILAPDRVIDLEAHDKVAKAQETLVKALLYLFKVNHKDDSIFLAKVVNTLVELRSMNVRNFEEEERFHMDFADIKWPQLFMDFFPTLSFTSDLLLPPGLMHKMASEVCELDIDLDLPEDITEVEPVADTGVLLEAAELQQNCCTSLQPVVPLENPSHISSVSDLHEENEHSQEQVLTELQPVPLVSSSIPEC